MLFAQGGVGGGHALYLQDGRLHYVYNWLGEKIQKISSDVEVEPGKHVFTAEFEKTGDDATGSAVGTLTLYVDDAEVGSAADVMTQPGFFALTGDGLCVGRDSASPVSADYAAPFPFTGGEIDRVVVDVSATTTSTTRRRCSRTSRATERAYVRTTQRKPMWPVEVSTASPWRAAGR